MKSKVRYEPTIGLEIHCELRTNSKMFCGCPANHFGKTPNTQTCPVCLGLPGALPVPNRKAVEWTIMVGLALNSTINPESKFDRKHYFYPDLPKGYQISQYDEPLCFGGFLATSSGKVGITRVHLEEDTGKLQHTQLDGQKVSLVDFNRSGVALIEIVTDPDIHSASQAKEYSQKLQNIIRFLGVSDCDMEKGSMRLEANISWGLGLGYKVEVKNLNSFRFVEKAIDYELKRQKQILETGETPRQETRGWSEKTNTTMTQRYKETAADYRYFPEPDIPPMEFSKEFIARIRKTLPELPQTLVERLVKQLKVRGDYAEILVSDKNLLSFFEKALEIAGKSQIGADVLAGYLVNSKVDIAKTSPEIFISLLHKQKSEKVSDISLIDTWVKEALENFPDAVTDFKQGKTNAISALIGYVMKVSKGKADAVLARDMIEKSLKKS